MTDPAPMEQFRWPTENKTPGWEATTDQERSESISLAEITAAFYQTCIAQKFTKNQAWELTLRRFESMIGFSYPTPECDHHHGGDD